MPRIPLAVVSTSSEDSDGSENNLAIDFRATNWTVVNMDSMESIPFSEVSHQPYGMDSTFLDSVSHGSANLRARNSLSAPQDMVSTSLRLTPRSPRSLLAHGPQTHTQTTLNATHPRGSNGGYVPIHKTAGGIPPLSPVSQVVPDAPPIPRHGRKAKPTSRRTRALQVGAPRWRDSDGDMELLVRREVSKNGPTSPAVTEDYAVLSFDSSSGTSPMLTPPPLWVESPSKEKNRDKEVAEVPTPKVLAKAAAAKDRSAVESGNGKVVSVASSGSPRKAAEPKGKKPKPTITNATRLPLSGRRLSSPSHSNAVSPKTTTANKERSNGVPARQPPQLQTYALPSAVAPPLLQKAKVRASSPLKAAGRTILSAARRIGPVEKSNGTPRKQRTPPTAPAASSVFGVSGESGRGDGDAAAAASGSNAQASDEATSPGANARRKTTRHSADFLRGAVAAARGQEGATVLLPPVSPSSASASVASAGRSATTPSAVAAPFSPAPRTPTTTGQRSFSTEPEERRRRTRRFSTQSRDTDTNETIASSVETVFVKPHSRHPTLKPLVTSPDDSNSISPPRRESSKSPDQVATSALPALSPKQLMSTSAEEQPRMRRAQTMTPSTEATPTRRSSHRMLPSNFSATGPGSMNTLSTLLVDSPPSLRPQTREFNEKADLTLATPSFISPASRATAEKLVTFVRAVSDPEVLHVIYDYLVEQQRSTPRYRLAATACEELLERKEELLKTEAPDVGNDNEAAKQRGSESRIPAEVDSFTLDVKQAEGMSDTTKAAELRRLLAELAVEQEAKEEEENVEDADEFDDFNFFDTPYPAQGHFSFGQPTVSGVVSRVFAEGMLFKIKTSTGEYYFYNDTLQDVMMVRVQCVLRGNETINERAMLAPVEGTRETEITIAVLPEETNFFMSGVLHLPHFMAKRVSVPPDYASPSVTQSLRKINADINSVRKALGKWSRASDQSAFLKCCLRHHLKFTDLTFRPSAESLFRPDCDAVSIPPVTWRRPEEYVYLPEVSQVRLFRGEISCFLVKQGELGNHTVVAAMAAVAQFPDHVRWMFRHPVSAHVGKLERAEGCYRVTLLHNGWWKTYVIDDYVPASQKGPLFASCAEDPRRLWVPLLEKAYAKSLGSYAATCVVDAMEAVGDFTGFPVRYLDEMWATAKAKPTGQPSRTLFNYINRVVRAGCLVLLFTPAASDAQSRNTVDLSRKRSARLLPVKGVTPQFLPGHIYFLHDVAFYEELDLRMAQLKNPWTWETKNKMYREKKWKYTTWYDRPDISVSGMGSVLGSSGAISSAPSRQQVLAAAAGAKADVSEAERLRNDRKGTMWVEWGEMLTAFAGGGVCYTLWRYHRYRAKNSFVGGRPRFVLEMKARRRVEVFVTLSLETVCETLDSYDTVVASRPLPLHGTAMAVVQRLSKKSARVSSESCEDVECVAARRTYVVAKDVSMKVTIDPRVADGTVLVVPLLHPQAVENMATAAAPAASSSPKKAGSGPEQPEVHFVLSIVTEAVVGDGEDLSISFVSMRRSCRVFTDAVSPFDLEGTSRVTAPYQICTEAGVRTLEGNRICDVESTVTTSSARRVPS